MHGNDYEKVVISGGDGTLNEAVCGMIDGKVKAPLGYIPAGTTNDFAHSLKIPRKILEAAEIAVNGKEFPCDIGMINGEYFIYVAAFGTLSDISYVTSQKTKKVLGHGAYIVEGFKQWHGLDRIHTRVETDDMKIDDEFCYGMVGNSRYTAGVKLNYASEVSMNDGMFEVILIKTPNNPKQFSDVMLEFLNAKKTKKNVLKFKTSKVKFSFDYPITWTRDGECGDSVKNVEIEVVKQPIRIMVPDREKGR